MSGLRRILKADLKQFYGTVKEEYAGVEIAVGITREMVERGEFDTMREGIEAAGVIPVAFSVSRYLNTTDYFPWKVLQAIRLGGKLFRLHKKMQQEANPYLKRLR